MRRLLSPAETLNGLTIGALHHDESGDYPPGNRIDLFPNASLFSLAMRVGHGFRRAIKPDVLFPGGRQLYQEPYKNSGTEYKVSLQTPLKPGQRAASDSKTAGELDKTHFPRGTSNATALASRGAAQICDVLRRLGNASTTPIPNTHEAVLIKALLVHGARQPEQARQQLLQQVQDRPLRQQKSTLARYLGYGAVDIERVLTCTAQRVTVLGYGDLGENQSHEYEFPLPMGLSGQKLWRRITITLAWFTPINPAHRNLREAKLSIEPGGETWKDCPLKLERKDNDHHQVKRGTVQHEILEKNRNLIAAYQDGEVLRLHITCKKDGTARLDDLIPYGLAITLEIKEDVPIPIYQQVQAKIQQSIPVAIKT